MSLQRGLGWGQHPRSQRHRRGTGGAAGERKAFIFSRGSLLFPGPRLKLFFVTPLNLNDGQMRKGFLQFVICHLGLPSS